MIRRRFLDASYGQVHYRILGAAASAPPGRPTLLALHQASGSSRSLGHVIEAFAAARPVVAPDLAGNGDSSALPEREPAMAAYAQAILPLLDRETHPVDLYGFHAGASVAIELAIARPSKVRRVVLDSLGLYSAADAEAMIRDYVVDFPLDRHGAHLVKAWHMVRDTYLFWPWFKQDGAHARGVGIPNLEMLNEKVIEVIKSLETFGDLYRAAFRHDKEARLPLVKAPTLVTAGRSNSQRGHLERIAKLLPRAQVLETEGTYSREEAKASIAAISAWLDSEAA